MHRYLVELRMGYAKTKQMHVMAGSHLDARLVAEATYGLLVLSTEFLE